MTLSLAILLLFFDVQLSTGCNDLYRDVGFILDTSASMCTEYPKAKEFINVLSRIANFTLNRTHGAFMLFHAWQGMKEEFKPYEVDGVEIEFSDQIDLEHYQRTINETILNIYNRRPRSCDPPAKFPCCPAAPPSSMYCCMGLTDIIRALTGSLTLMFQSSSGMREYVEQVAILITDGQDTDGKGDPINEGHQEYPRLLEKYVEMAETFKQRKIKILAIGVGDVGEKTLETLVQSPEHFIKADTFEDLVDNLTELIGAIMCKDPQIGPCPAGYTQVDGHVNQAPSNIRHVNATREECEEYCENDAKCVSFEFCHYWCDPNYGFPYANQCIINYKSYPQGDTPVNFFQCSKDCPNFFAKAEVLYCDKDCGANWLDNKYGCQIDDANAFCRLKHCNENATAKSFDVVQATHQPGFACRGIGSEFRRKRNGIEYGYHGIMVFNYDDDIKNSHGEGKVITNVICENKTSDCIWSEWRDTDCSVTCGKGTKTLRRLERKPAEIEDGGTCDGSNEKIEPCDTRIPCKCYGCVDGDVKLTRGNLPQIYWDRKWMNICPFQFMDNKYAIELFCAKFGLYLGGTTRRASELEEKYHKKIKYYESFLVGTCKSDDKWPYCSTDCNIENLGKGCDFVDYPRGNKTKKYYVCRKEQSWLYFLDCNGSKDLPLSSCYDIKEDRSGAKTEISGGNLTLSTASYTFDDQVFNSKSFEIPVGKPIKAGASMCILNLHTVFIEIFISAINFWNYFSELI